MTKILQIDREAAADIGGCHPHQDIIRKGKYDNHPYVQRVASHREQATAKLYEALSDMVAMAVALGPDTWDISDLSDEGAVLKAARTALAKYREKK